MVVPTYKKEGTKILRWRLSLPYYGYSEDKIATIYNNNVTAIAF